MRAVHFNGSKQNGLILVAFLYYWIVGRIEYALNPRNITMVSAQVFLNAKVGWDFRHVLPKAAKRGF